MPETSHRRPVFFNQLPTQKSRREHSGAGKTQRCRQSNNHVTFPTTRPGPLIRQSHTSELKYDHDASGSNPNSCLLSYLTLARGNSSHLSSQGKSRVRQRVRRTLLNFTFRLSCAHTRRRLAPGIHVLMPKKRPPTRTGRSTSHIRSPSFSPTPSPNSPSPSLRQSGLTLAPVPPHFSKSGE